MNYPASCLRGIRSSDFLNKEGTVLGPAFMPNDKTAAKRKDGGRETSINWEDDNGALPLLAEDTVNAKYGVARLPTAAVDALRVAIDQSISVYYERDPLKGNQYHGNLIFPRTRVIGEIRALCGMLAVNSKVIPKASADALKKPANTRSAEPSIGVDE